MSGLDASEVLLYLNQLGYQNITAKQLKEFMKDLKKLIKYDTKHRETEIENIEPPSAPCQYNRFGCSLLAPTEASKAKEVYKKEQIVSVHIKRPTRACHNNTKCSNYNPKTTNKQSFHANTLHESQVSGSEQKFYSDVPKVKSNSNSEEAAVSPKRPKSCDVECQKSKVKFKGNVLRPKTSFIVPRLPTKTCKSDPVALYRKYQELWKKQKLPGEDNHSELRWAIRERMLGEPQAMSAAPSMEAIARKRKTTDRI